jgi:hypothetical protein
MEVRSRSAAISFLSAIERGFRYNGLKMSRTQNEL